MSLHSVVSFNWCCSCMGLPDHECSTTCTLGLCAVMSMVHRPPNVGPLTCRRVNGMRFECAARGSSWPAGCCNQLLIGNSTSPLKAVKSSESNGPGLPFLQVLRAYRHTMTTMMCLSCSSLAAKAGR